MFWEKKSGNGSGNLELFWDGPGESGKRFWDYFWQRFWERFWESSWELGMAHSVTDGWAGEDCLFGSGSYQFCHPIGVDHTLSQVETCAPDDIIEGVSTVLDASTEPDLSYILRDSGGACFVLGADVSYYQSLGCAQMP